MIRQLALTLALLLAPPAQAVEFVEADGPLDDETFYRAVACGAAPGKACARPFARWPEDRAGALTVSLSGVDPKFPIYKLSWVRDALDEEGVLLDQLGFVVTCRIRGNSVALHQ